MKKFIDLLFLVFGIIATGIGLINTFWGNDPFYGIFILIISSIYFPYTNNLIQKKLPFSISTWTKILIALFIFWASLGVGELFDKIEMMRQTFNM